MQSAQVVRLGETELLSAVGRQRREGLIGTHTPAVSGQAEEKPEDEKDNHSSERMKWGGEQIRQEKKWPRHLVLGRIPTVSRRALGLSKLNYGFHCLMFFDFSNTALWWPRKKKKKFLKKELRQEPSVVGCGVNID